MNTRAIMLQRFPPVVWWVLGANALLRTTRYMIVPFLALYVSTHTHASATMIGLVIGVQAATSALSGIFAGVLADRFGRRIVMFAAMVASSFALVGFGAVSSLPAFIFFSALNGLTYSVFDPAAQATLAEATESSSRHTVFSIRYWSSNVGAGIGPIVGGLLGASANSLPFYIAAVLNLMIGCGVLYVLSRKPLKTATSSRPNKFSLSTVLEIVKTDKALLTFICAGILVFIGYSQVTATLPQYISHLMGTKRGLVDFTVIFTLNPVVILLFQFPVAKVSNRLGTLYSLVCGQILFSVGYLATAFSKSLSEFMLAMLLITLGEMMVFPANSSYLASVARVGYEATYFGFYSLRSIGSFLGPWLGGMILDKAGGTILFVLVASLTLVTTILYVISNVFHKQQCSVTVKGSPFGL